MATRYSQIKELFLAALDVPAAERMALVAARAGDDTALEAEVLSLLAHQGAPLLREPASAPVPVAPAPSADPIGAAGQTIDGRYLVHALVAEGGFSYVYRGEHLRLRRPVALKFFREQRTGQRAALERAFVNEASMLGELSRRTNLIVQSYDAGLWSHGAETWLYTVLEWLDGETLARCLVREREAGAGGWSIERMVATLDPIALALAVACDLGIAHRDLKPGNIFLAIVGDRVVPKLIDFGTAKVASEIGGFNAASSVIGVFTVAYAAPEQLSRELGPTGPWTDVYALALLCVELLLGRPPLHRGDLATILRRIVAGESLTPRGLGLEAPPALDAVLAVALATRPAERYPDVRQFWSALRTAVAA